MGNQIVWQGTNGFKVSAVLTNNGNVVLEATDIDISLQKPDGSYLVFQKPFSCSGALAIGATANFSATWTIAEVNAYAPTDNVDVILEASYKYAGQWYSYVVSATLTDEIDIKAPLTPSVMINPATITVTII